MHDIICPHCGESFIASDVAFDLSSYVLPLLYSNPKDSEDVKNVGFKYFIDEDTISKHAAPGNTVPLSCERPGGPDLADPWYPFVITNVMLREHIESQVLVDGNLSEIISEISKIQSSRSASYNTRQVNAIKAVYCRFFAASGGNYEDFDIDDSNVQIAIKILIFIYSHPNETITLKVRVSCSKMNPDKPNYRVPDVLFVLKNGIMIERHRKCCRYCGTAFPQEYGYFKMMPVVLLGSHYAGKTSYLLSLLYTVQNINPFSNDGVGNRSINVTTLNDDDNLVAFSKNIERFTNGEDPDKTDFSNVPILNLLVNNIIYTFIDWPGEKFIDVERRSSDDYIFNSKKVAMKARHFLCFLEPSQIDLNRVEAEERVKFPPHALVSSFSWHMSFAIEKLRSITFIVNKVDLYEGDANNPANPNAQPILNLIRDKSETSVYSGGKWSEEEFKAMDATTQGFLQVQHPNLLSGLNRMPRFTDIPKCFLPVAPYGRREAHNDFSVVHHTRLAGIPLLRIMEIDKKLMKRS